jgi:N-succinyldiaminopimelate aminotransferase
MNPRLANLHAYPFERLAQLKATVQPPPHLPHIAMSIGEPQHAPPTVVLQALERNLERLGSYPATAAASNCARPPRSGSSGALRCAPERSIRIRWCCRSTARAKPCSHSYRPWSIAAPLPLVLMPNPGYQIYEGAALLAGAEPYFLDATRRDRLRPES